MLSLSISIDYRTSIFYIQAFPRLTPHSLTWSSLFLLFCWTVLTFAWYVLFLLFSHSVTPMDCSTPCFPVLHYLLEFVQTHVHQVSDAIQPSHPLLSPSPPATGFFSNESTLCIRWPKCWSFSFSISPSN